MKVNDLNKIVELLEKKEKLTEIITGLKCSLIEEVIGIGIYVKPMDTQAGTITTYIPYSEDKFGEYFDLVKVIKSLTREIEKVVKAIKAEIKELGVEL